MKKTLGFCLSFFICFFISHKAFSIEEYKSNEEEAKAYNVTRVTKTVEGLKFVVQEDRPIEKVGGIYRPIDLDSYVTLKFNKLEKKINEINASIEKRLDELFIKMNALDKKVEELYKQRTKPPLNQTQDRSVQ